MVGLSSRRGHDLDNDDSGLRRWGFYDRIRVEDCTALRREDVGYRSHAPSEKRSPTQPPSSRRACRRHASSEFPHHQGPSHSVFLVCGSTALLVAITAAGTGFVVYCKANDILQPGFWASGNMGSLLTGAPGGMDSYFEVGLLNRSTA